MKLGVKHLRAFLRPSDPFIKRLMRAANGQIEGVRALLVAGIQAVTEGMGIQLHEPYLWLLVRRMTWDGVVRAVSYHRIGSEFGPLKRAAFEQPLQTLLQAAQRGQTDTCTGPTEACIFSRRFDPTEPEPEPAQQGEWDRSRTLNKACAIPSDSARSGARLHHTWCHSSEGARQLQSTLDGLWGDLGDIGAPTCVEEYCPESPSYNPTSPCYNPTSPPPPSETFLLS